MTPYEMYSIRHLAQELVKPDVAIFLQSALFFAMAFSQRQREWVKRRDRTCQAPFKHACTWNKGTIHQHIHHILPQRYCEAIGIDNADIAFNGIALCDNAHVGNTKFPDDPCIHPDIREAKTHYGENHASIEEVFVKRNTLVEQKMPYWNTMYDRVFHAVAMRNTQRMRDPFPEKKTHDH